MGRPGLRVERSKSEYKVVKKCIGCEKEIPVACKTCPLCKASVTLAKPSKTVEDVEKDSPSKVRRTERVRRERPDFFNSLEVDKRFKKKRRRKLSKESAVETSSTNSSKTSSESSSASGTKEDQPRRKRGRPKSLSQPEIPPVPDTPPEEEPFFNLPPEKLLQYQVILSEINRKISTQTFKPI